MHHPWRAFSALVDWTLQIAPLPVGLLAFTDHETRHVTLADDLEQVERRCSIEHERQHILDPEGSEEAVCRRTARVLLPEIRAVGEALAWAHDVAEAADELWVDEDVLIERLRGLHPAERHYLRRRLARQESAA